VLQQLKPNLFIYSVDVLEKINQKIKRTSRGSGSGSSCNKIAFRRTYQEQKNRSKGNHQKMGFSEN
jgi:hypothetical protein